LRFFAVPVRGSWILKLSGTGPVRGPSKKGNWTETGLDFKALINVSEKCKQKRYKSRTRPLCVVRVEFCFQEAIDLSLHAMLFPLSN
jgi:hypothetical protein